MTYRTYAQEWYDEETNKSYEYNIVTAYVPATYWEPSEEEVILEAYYIDDAPSDKVEFLLQTRLTEQELFDGNLSYSDYLPEHFDEHDGWR